MYQDLLGLIADWDQICRIGSEQDLDNIEKVIELFINDNRNELCPDCIRLLEDYGFDDLV
ncbi:MAG: hypothetical protein R3321_01415 [Nitrososphaeraceae archaeon]|nr:hypothetical protein [Nitrososphaeraceae archaeon]